MQAWATRLAAIGSVHTFDYEYMQGGKRRPDPLPALVARHRAEYEALRTESERPVLVGKSMGSRVGCHLAVELWESHEPVRGLVCFGYPLVGSGKTRPVRDAVLLGLRSPILFVQGDRDSLCPLSHLERVRSQMQAPSRLFVVEGGDHSLAVRKRELSSRGVTQDDVDRAILEEIRRFVLQLS